MTKASAVSRPILYATLAFLTGCSADGARYRTDESAPAVGSQLFTLLPAAYTGVHFENRLEETAELNVFTYRNFYNGGGVALGDLTGDGMPPLGQPRN